MWNKITLIVFTSIIFYLSNSVATSTSLSSGNSVNKTIGEDTLVVNRSSNRCQCHNYSCGCCGHLEEHKIYLNATVCVNATYLNNDYGFSLTMTYNNYTVFNETVSVRNPPPVCIGAPYLKEYAELCARLYDLDVSRESFHGCADVEARLKKVLVAEYELGCFDVGHLHQSIQRNQQNINNSLFVPSVTQV